MIVATAGHIDHGKTTLVKALTGVDTDRLPEEKARGISIDLGFAYLSVPDVEGGLIGFVDVPGHERFVRNMIAGVCGIDFALVVVAADDGVMPQTEEHVQILDLMGIRAGMIAVTKSDRVDAARVSEVAAQAQAMLAGTGLAGARWLPVSPVSGAGVAALREALTEAARGTQSRHRPERLFRYAIDRAFTVKGSGTVVTGTVFDGQALAGDRLMVAPKGMEARVRQIQIHGKVAGRVGAGQRCALNIAGVSVADVGRGGWVLAPTANLPTRRLEASCTLLAQGQGGAHAQALGHWSPVDVHIATARVRARIATDARKPLAPGETRVLQLVLEQEIIAAHGDRFILREPSARHTLGGGVVLDPFAPATRRHTPARLAYVEALQSEDAGAALDKLLAMPGQALDLARFEATFSLTPEHAAKLYQQQAAVLLGRERRWAASQATLAAATEAVLKELTAFHAAAPATPAMGVPSLRRAAAPQLSAPAFLALLQHLAAAGKVEVLNAAARLVHRGAAADSEDEALWGRLLAALDKGGLAPPAIDKLAPETGATEKALKDLLFRRRGSGEVLRIPGERYYRRATMAMFAATAAMLARAGAGGTFSAAQFRDATGINRTLCIEILEFLDSLGITRRVGDVRKIVRDPASVLGASPPCPKPAVLPSATPPRPSGARKKPARRW